MIGPALKNELLRKLIHLSSLWMVVFIHMTDKSVSIPFFAGLLIVFFAFEYIRMQNKAAADFMSRYFSLVMRKGEHTSHFRWSALTGSFYFIVSVLLSLILFSKPVAITGILIMIFADTIAALVGKSIGKQRIQWADKTVEGCAAFFITTVIILIAMGLPLSTPAIAIIGLLTTPIELVSNHIHVNDNLSITLGAGTLISLLAN